MPGKEHIHFRDTPETTKDHAQKQMSLFIKSHKSQSVQKQSCHKEITVYKVAK